MIATFVGFLLALLGERWYDWYKDKEEGKCLIDSLEKEIRDILFFLNTAGEQQNVAWLHPIKTPIWDSVISMGKLSLVNNLCWYTYLLQLYDEVKDYNEWHRMRTRQYYCGGKIDAISSSLKELEGEIKEKANLLINDMGTKKKTRENKENVKSGTL